jgi:hypothetical protein
MFVWMVASMSAAVACLCLIWLVSPALRRRMEIPKYRMLERETRYRNHSQ